MTWTKNLEFDKNPPLRAAAIEMADTPACRNPGKRIGELLIEMGFISREQLDEAMRLEIMIGTQAVKSLIREQKTHQLPTIIQTSQKIGMQSMDQVLKNLVMRGKVSAKEAAMYASNPVTFDPNASTSYLKQTR